MGRLLWSQVTKHKELVVFCYRCPKHFEDEVKLHIHKSYCSKNKELRIDFPEVTIRVVKISRQPAHINISREIKEKEMEIKEMEK